MIAGRTRVDLPSPSPVTPCWARISIPLKLRFSLMFTTPAMASEPYVAEEPPVRISTLSISDAGIVFRSDDAVHVSRASRARRPPGTSVRDVAQAAKVDVRPVRTVRRVVRDVVVIDANQLRQLR